VSGRSGPSTLAWVDWRLDHQSVQRVFLPGRSASCFIASRRSCVFALISCRRSKSSTSAWMVAGQRQPERQRCGVQAVNRGRMPGPLRWLAEID
jgi:hypothetical protein